MEEESPSGESTLTCVVCVCIFDLIDVITRRLGINWRVYDFTLCSCSLALTFTERAKSLIVLLIY